MLIFVYEHQSDGGFQTEPQRSNEAASLAAEGDMMRAALTADLAAIDGIEVAGLRSRCIGHLPEERDAAFDELAAKADWTVVIAPEIGGALRERCQRVVQGGGRLLGGSLPTVLLAGDKHATATHLAAAGVPVPLGVRHELGEPWPESFRYPAVWKPLDGAGSAGLRLIEHHDAPLPVAERRSGRLEEVCPSSTPLSLGIAASVAFFCGPAGAFGLPPCRQHIGEHFRYLGGSLPLDPPLAERARRLARRAVDTLPEPLGYIGVDLVLSTEDEANDVVIEINPRLTTSYCGLRAACRDNLAAAMLAVAGGREFGVSFREAPVAWKSVAGKSAGNGLQGRPSV